MSKAFSSGSRAARTNNPSRAKQVGMALAVTGGIVGSLAGIGYAGISIGYKNDTLTAAEQHEAYDKAVKDMSPSQRFLAEFVTGVNICNPEDSDNAFQSFGIFPSIEACGRAEAPTFPEQDESLGSVCLMGSVYDPEFGGIITSQDAGLSVDPGMSTAGRLTFTVESGSIVPADQQTIKVLQDHGCVS